MFTLRNLTHLVLHIVTNGKECLTKLPIVDLCQEVSLILHRIGTRTEPLAALLVDFGLGIVARGNKVVVVTPFLVEGPELNQTIAHHIRIGRQTSTHLVHRVGRHLMPIFLMTVDDF